MNLVELGKKLMQEIPALKEGYDEELDHIGQIVFALRMEKRLTQRELAALAQVEEHIIHKIEGGNIRVGESDYRHVLQVLGVKSGGWKWNKKK